MSDLEQYHSAYDYALEIAHDITVRLPWLYARDFEYLAMLGLEWLERCEAGRPLYRQTDATRVQQLRNAYDVTVDQLREDNNRRLTGQEPRP